MFKRNWICAVSLSGTLFIASHSLAQDAGPVITGFGKVHKITDPDIPASPDMELKAVFDVDGIPDSMDPNPYIETAARFLNMHVQAGFTAEDLKVALVVHGNASEDLLNEVSYRTKHGKESKSAALVRELIRSGVQIAVCGQSATSRHITREQLIPGVQWSLSAMTALIHYQNQGYRFIKF